MQEQIYAIHQVAERFGVSQTTIRNWENALEGIIEIRRDGQDARYYTERDIQTFKLVEQLRNEGFGLAAIRKIFEQLHNNEGAFPALLPSNQPQPTQPSGVGELSSDQMDELAMRVAKALVPYFEQRFAQYEEAASQERLLLEAEQNSRAEADQRSRNEFMEHVNEVIRQANAQNEQKLVELQEQATMRFDEIAAFTKDQVSQIVGEQRQARGFWARLFGNGR